jgi:O-antigen ligase
MLIPFVSVIFITSIKKAYLKHIISAFLLAILFSEMISYLIFFELIDVNMLQAKHLLYAEASLTNPTPFMHHTEYSVFLSIASILLINKLLHTKNRLYQIFILLFLASATINLFINGGRTGQISYLLAISSYMFFYFKFNIKIIISTLLILSSVVFLAYNFSPTFHKRSHMALQNIEQISQGNYNTSWGLRVASAKVTLDYLLSSSKTFIFGAGAGDTRQVYLDHAKKHFNKNISEPIKILAHLHNQYLEYWMDGTLIALLLFLTFFVILTRLPVPDQYKPSLYAFAIIVAFASATDIPLFRYQPAMLFMLLIGYFVLISRENQRV